MARQLIIVSALIMSAFTAHAEDTSNFYYGIALGGGEIKLEDDFAAGNGAIDDSQSDIKDVSFTLGYEIFSFFSIEGRFAAASDDNGSLLGDPLAYRAAGLGRLNYAADKVNAYLVGGLGIAQYDFAGTTEDEISIVAGAGIDLFGNDSTALSAGILVQPGNDINYTVLNVGFRHYFGGAK